MRCTSVLVFTVVALVARSLGGVVAREVPSLLVIGCGDLAANGLFAVASSRGEVSVASVLGSLYPVMTILLARVVLAERLRPIQQVGAVLSLAGAAVIAL
jgi:drug/metabolite transporter (DMT)-like permease